MQNWLSNLFRTKAADPAANRRPRAVIRRAWANRLPPYTERLSRRVLDKPILKARDLSCVYADGDRVKAVLQGVSLDLHRAELVLIMGKSGSGKSTLLKILSGAQAPHGGRVVVLGEDYWALPPAAQDRFRRRHYGQVFQANERGYNLLPALTARQQLEMVLRWGEGVPPREARRRAEDMLRQLGLAERMEARPGQMSGGQQQRVAIGRALLLAPDFIFADEPTGALDSATGREVMQLLRSAAHERGASVVVVTHDKDLKSFADRIVYMKDGLLTDEEAWEREAERLAS